MQESPNYVSGATLEITSDDTAFVDQNTASFDSIFKDCAEVPLAYLSKLYHRHDAFFSTLITLSMFVLIILLDVAILRTFVSKRNNIEVSAVFLLISLSAFPIPFFMGSFLERVFIQFEFAIGPVHRRNGRSSRLALSWLAGAIGAGLIAILLGAILDIFK